MPITTVSTDERRRTPLLLLAAGVVVLIVVALAVTEAGNDDLSVAEAMLLGIVEGITEYLPVSSTGHLLLTQDLLGLTDTPATEAAADSYAISIQLGAIVAVAVLYRQRITGTIAGLARPAATDEGRSARMLTGAIVVAFAPAAIVGVLVGDAIKDRLFSPGWIALAWFVGGVAILVFERHRAPTTRPLEMITVRDGAIIGAAQILALWPGTSRSLVTIIAAVLVGMSMKAAVEFSFLLGLLTLTAATAYEILRNGQTVVDTYGYLTPAIGFVAALISAAAAVTWLVDHLQRHGLAAFGWYRIGLAAATVVLAATVLGS